MSSRCDLISAGVTRDICTDICRYLQISAQMSFPPGDVIVTPFVGDNDENDGAVAPPQGSEFFEDVKGDYYDGLQNEDGEDRIAPGSAVLCPRQTWGGA